MAGFDGGLSRKLNWILNMEGNLEAETDKTVASVKALGLSAKETKARIAELRAEQREAAEASQVQQQNLLGLAGAVGAVAVGVGLAASAFERWTQSVVESNTRLRDLGVNTGAAGNTIDRYSTAIDSLTTSFDKLNVKLGAGVLDKLGQAATLLDKIVSAVPGGDIGSKIGDAIVAGVNSVSPTLGAALTIGSTALTAGGQPTPPVRINGLTPDEYSLLGPVARPYKKWVPYQKRMDWKLPGVMTSDPTFLSTPPPGVAGLGGSSVSDVIGGTGFSIDYQQMAQSIYPAPKGPGLSKATAQSVSNTIGAFGSGSLSTALGALGPYGMVAGAVVGAAPTLGKTFDGLVDQAAKLPNQLVAGIDHILAKLPTVLSKTIPDLVTDLVSAIPKLVVALATALPAIIKAALVDLPKAIGQAVAQFFTGSGAPIRRALAGGTDADSYGIRTALAVSAAGGGPLGGGGYGSAPYLYGSGSKKRSTGQGGGLHFHLQGTPQEQARAARKIVGSYGLGYTYDPLVT